jgi:hypothetical protein
MTRGSIATTTVANEMKIETNQKVLVLSISKQTYVGAPLVYCKQYKRTRMR